MGVRVAVALALAPALPVHTHHVTLCGPHVQRLAFDEMVEEARKEEAAEAGGGGGGGGVRARVRVRVMVRARSRVCVWFRSRRLAGRRWRLAVAAAEV